MALASAIEDAAIYYALDGRMAYVSAAYVRRITADGSRKGAAASEQLSVICRNLNVRVGASISYRRIGRPFPR